MCPPCAHSCVTVKNTFYILTKKLRSIKYKFKKILNPKDNLSHDNRFRGMNIKVDSIEEDFDLDISLAQKRSNVEYSS